MLKHGSKNYLQQELRTTFRLPRPAAARCRQFLRIPTTQPEVPRSGGGAKDSILSSSNKTATAAGRLVADQVTPDLIGIANAFEMAQPEIFAQGIVALVDIGFRHSTISILLNGELSLNRVVGLGGEKSLGTGRSDEPQQLRCGKAKLTVTDDAQPVLMSLLMPLGRELRASLDFSRNRKTRP